MDNAEQQSFRLSIAVTGGLGDIGAATGRRLARDGHTVMLVDLMDPARGLSLIADWERADPSLSGRLSYARADITDSSAVTAMVESQKRLDAIIMNAGTVRSAPFLEIDEADWQRQLSVNLTGAFLCAQAAARRMVREGTRGLLLFTGSWVANVPWPEITAYTASKAGMENLARQAARELARYGIRSNVVAPGIVRAGLAKTQLETEPQYAARAARVVPLGELQTVDQVAAAFSFLCSTDSEYMTGATLTVDGGASLFAFD
ncbi:MAG: SDR family oxidoreductase [Salinibacterium sp.]|nr:SDR family oxidoreductase [Salinibacterium sp.]